MVLFPLTGIVTLVDAAYTEAMDNSTGDDHTALVETYDDYFVPFIKNPAFTFIESVGANAMSNGIATVKVDGEKTNMRDEVLSVSTQSSLTSEIFRVQTSPHLTPINRRQSALLQTPSQDLPLCPEFS
jgi:hypothetical protein